MALTSKVEMITPQLAAKWLEDGEGNFRRTDQARVKNYADEMSAGNWDVNGETIKFNGKKLIDGKHRLHAVVKSGCKIRSLVVRGVTTDASHVDRGKPRTVAQWLAYSDVRNANIVAAASRMCLVHDKGLWGTTAWGVGFATDSEVIEFAMQHHEMLRRAASSTRVDGISQAALAAVLFIGSGRQDATANETAIWFRDALVSGENLQDTDAVLHLRNRLLRQGKSDRMTRFMSRMLLTVAWNKTVKGEECKRSGLKLRLTGPVKQKPPTRILVADLDTDEG